MWLALRVTISQCWLVSLNKSEQPKNGSGSSPGRVFAPYWSENGYTLCPFWSGIGFDFWGNCGIVWTYLSFQLYSKWVEKKEKFSMQIRNGIEEFFCLRANLSNDNIISAWKARSENGYGFSRSCLKTGGENYIFWSEIESGFGEPGGTPLPRIPRSILPGGADKFVSVSMGNFPWVQYSTRKHLPFYGKAWKAFPSGKWTKKENGQFRWHPVAWS